MKKSENIVCIISFKHITNNEHYILLLVIYKFSWKSNMSNILIKMTISTDIILNFDIQFIIIPLS